MTPERLRNAEPIRVASWPHWYAPNRYLDLLYGALAAHGIVHVPDVPFTWRSLSGAEPAIHAVHMHWPEPYWREPTAPLPLGLLRVVRLRRLLRRLRASGRPVIWTVHNLQPHDAMRASDRFGYRVLHGCADLRVFHSAWAHDVSRSRHADACGATLVMPHGNYDGILPPARPRAVTLNAAGIPPARHVLLCFGQVRHYKGFDVALAALDYLDAGVHLVIAGRPVDSAADALHPAQRRDNATLLLREVSDQALADWLEAADAVLLPYRAVTSSGVLLHALTCSRGVVASDLPSFREVLGPEPAAGVLVRPDDPEALARGIEDFLRVPPLERSRAARRLADRYAWERIVPPLAAWMRRQVGRE